MDMADYFVNHAKYLEKLTIKLIYPMVENELKMLGDIFFSFRLICRSQLRIYEIMFYLCDVKGQICSNKFALEILILPISPANL